MGATAVSAVNRQAGRNLQLARYLDFTGYSNRQRPHQALEMKVPADLNARSTRLLTGLEEISYLMQDRTVTVTQCGRVCYNRQEINLSRAFAGQNVEAQPVAEKVWLVSLMQYDPGYFDSDTCRREPIENPFAAKVFPMCPEWTKGVWERCIWLKRPG